MLNIFTNEKGYITIEQYTDLSGGWQIVEVTEEYVHYEVYEAPIYGGKWCFSEEFITLKEAYDFVETLT